MNAALPRKNILPRSSRLHVVALDVTKPESIAAALEASGPIDVLVNNAGIGLLGAFGEQVDSQRSQRRRLGAALAAKRIEAQPLSEADVVLYRATLRLIALRPFALLARVARSLPDAFPAAAAQEAWSHLAGEVEQVRREAGFQPVSLKATVAVQLLSGLIAAHRVANPR